MKGRYDRPDQSIMSDPLPHKSFDMFMISVTQLHSPEGHFHKRYFSNWSLKLIRIVFIYIFIQISAGKGDHRSTITSKLWKHQNFNIMSIECYLTRSYWWQVKIGIGNGMISTRRSAVTLQWRHNGRGSVSNHQPHDCFLNRLFRRRSKKTPKLRVTGLCVGNSPEAGELPAQMASNAENVSIWWRHHDLNRWRPRSRTRINIRSDAYM